jgi:hypothetical protein
MRRLALLVALLVGIVSASAWAQGENLHPPVWSIQACNQIGNITGDLPVKCIGEGGGKNGFWGRRPEILVRFRGLPVGNHTLKTRYYAYDNSRFKWAGNKYDQIMSFRNNQPNWAFWFSAVAEPGEINFGTTPYKVEIYLDGRWHGDVVYEGSPE